MGFLVIACFSPSPIHFRIISEPFIDEVSHSYLQATPQSNAFLSYLTKVNGCLPMSRSKSPGLGSEAVVMQSKPLARQGSRSSTTPENPHLPTLQATNTSNLQSNYQIATSLQKLVPIPSLRRCRVYRQQDPRSQDGRTLPRHS